MRQQPVSIKDVLKNVVSQLSGEKRRKIELVKDAWKQVVDNPDNGTPLMRGKAYMHARPASFKAKRLIVNVDSSAWIFELNLRKQELKAKLNERLKKDDIVVSNIILRIGEVG